MKKGQAVKPKQKNKESRKTSVRERAEVASEAPTKSRVLGATNKEQIKSQKTKSVQVDTDKVGQNDSGPLNLSEVEEITRKHGLSLESDKEGKRIYRRRKELPEPGLDPKASANRLARQLPPRVYQEHFELFNECARSFPSKREALQRAIELLAAELNLDKK
jgi:hypothetical protein